MPRMRHPALNEPQIGAVGVIRHAIHRLRMRATRALAFTDRPLPGPIRYTVNTPWRIVLHTTEGSTTTTYQNGAEAPQLTVSVQQRRTWRHYDYTRYAGKALQHPPGTPATNTTRAVQIEVIGYCDDKKVNDPLHVSHWTDADYAYLRSVLQQIAADTGCPLTTSVRWKPFPESFGANGIRLSRAGFATVTGVIGHEHAPDNDHGDPGNPDMGRLLAPPPPTPAPGREPMYQIAKIDGYSANFQSDGKNAWWLRSPAERKAAAYQAAAFYGSPSAWSGTDANVVTYTPSTDLSVDELLRLLMPGGFLGPVPPGWTLSADRLTLTPPEGTP